MAEIAVAEENLPRAQQVYAQCLTRWPQDPGVPEVLLRQGLLYRRMGLPRMAVGKFYSVMTSALVLRPELLDYYKQLVLRAQMEIAATQYDLGEYTDATDSFNRLLKLDTPPGNRASLQYQYIRCLSAVGRQGESIAQAENFLEHYPDAPERPEVHFVCASALKEAGRNAEALRQVLALLQEQRAGGAQDSLTVAYWQRRAGNEIANRFYQEGDVMKALDIYLSLATLDKTPDWQFPVWYQVGLVFERLHQPAKASEYYAKIIAREQELPANGAPSLKAVVEMARWRKDFLTWQVKTELVNLELHATVAIPANTNANN
jgi:tetratricopeptide (TPR) repeat protein